MSFSVHPHEILAIIGESGSGKTVTALSLMKLVPTPPGRYLGGTVEIAGVDLLALDERSLEDVRGKIIGMIFQNPRASLDPSFTAGSQLIETLQRHEPALDQNAAQRAAHAALVEVGFGDPEPGDGKLPASIEWRHVSARWSRHGAGLQAAVAHRG
ncbi:ABC transporter ATP-binding protein [Nordella sp. HKS 07]|nr:ATP-binding cassette domain-containing protein [Nordella sp. HKS 07]QIG46677.1 ABC transporter ATP-binding protein [Nordella sp. HKS 07]